MTTPKIRRVVRHRFSIPLLAGLAAATVVASWLVPGVGGLGPESARALDIRREDGFYLVTVKDAFAHPERYRKQLAELGIDIRLQVEPVSPGLVGTIFTPFDPRLNGLPPAQQDRHPEAIQPVEGPGACAKAVRCTIGLRISVDYRPYKGPDHQGPAVISLGRKARPGERYMGFGALNNPGEPLECRRYMDKTVDQVRTMLRERGVSIGTFAVPLRGFRHQVPGSWYVHEGWLTAPGKALLVADEKPNRGRGMSTFPPMPQRCPGD